MWNEEGKSKIMQYVLENHDLDIAAIRLVRNAIDYAEKLNGGAKCDFLLAALGGVGFTDNEINAFACGEAPRLEVYPANVIISRSYRTYVSVPPGKSKDEIMQAAINHILDGQDSVLVDDELLDIEKDDIKGVDIDFGGVQIEL